MSCATSDSAAGRNNRARSRRCAGARTLAGCFAAVLVLASGCKTFNMPTPENFARQYPSRPFRALTSDEDKLYVRHFRVRETQSLSFWADAVRKNLVEERGYTLMEEGEFETDAAVPGQRFLFEVSAEDVPFRYQLTLFMTYSPRWLRWFRRLGLGEHHAYVAEFLCEKKNYEKSAPAVDKALKQFEPKRGRIKPPAGD